MRLFTHGISYLVAEPARFRLLGKSFDWTKILPVICSVIILIFPLSTIADCGNARQSYMASPSLSSANALITCLEIELARAGTHDECANCPPIPIVSVSEPKPGNPVGAEQYYAYLQYYFNVTGLSAIEWMQATSAAIQDTDDIAITLGNLEKQHCTYEVPLRKFDWGSSTFIDSGSRMNVWLIPKMNRGGK